MTINKNINVKNNIIIAIILLISILLLWQLSKVLIPFFIGIFLAYLLDPIVDLLEEKKISRGFGTFIVLLIFYISLLLTILLIFPIFIEQTKGFLTLFPNLMDEVEKIINLILKYFRKSFNDIEKLDILLGLKNNIPILIDKILNNLMFSSLAVFNFFGLIIITPVISWYLLKDWDFIKSRIEKSVPIKHKKKFLKNAEDINHILASYFRGQFLVSFLLAIYYSVTFFLIDLNYSLFLGIFTGLLTFIPILGILISMVTSILLAFLQYFNFIYIIYVLSIFLIGQLLESYLLTPKIIGKKLGIHPAMIIFSVIVFGAVFGIVGIFFAIPLTSIFIFYFEKFIKNINK